MSYSWRASDHAFEAFLAGAGERFDGVEKTMFKYFKTHPGRTEFLAVERAIVAYAKGRTVGGG